MDCFMRNNSVRRTQVSTRTAFPSAIETFRMTPFNILYLSFMLLVFLAVTAWTLNRCIHKTEKYLEQPVTPQSKKAEEVILID